MRSAAVRKLRMKLSDIRATLEELGLSPSKALGQNFLHDQNLARWMVNQADITPDNYLVEIGPGFGALTGLIFTAVSAAFNSIRFGRFFGVQTIAPSDPSW